MTRSWDKFLEDYFDRYFGAIARACYASLHEASSEGPQGFKEAQLSAFLRKEQTRARTLLRAMYDDLAQAEKPGPATPTPTKRVGV